jgi:chromosome segregation ATPase
MAKHAEQLASEKDSALTEITRLRQKITDLETQLDGITVADQKLLSELKQSFSLKEIEFESKLARLSNTGRARIADELDRIREDCRWLRMELGLFKSKHTALLNESIEELKEQEKRTQAIVEENGNLKFRLSQVLNSFDDSYRIRTSGFSRDSTRRMTERDATSQAHEGGPPDLQAPIAALTKEKGELIGRIDQLQAENGQMGERIVELGRQTQKLEIRLRELATENSGLKTRIAELETERDGVLKEDSPSGAPDAKFEEKEAGLSVRIAELESENRLLSEEKCELETRIALLEREGEEMVHGGSDTKIDTPCFDDETPALEASVSSPQGNEDRKIAELTQRSSELEDEIRALKAIASRKLRLALRDHHKVEARLQEENDALQQEIDRLRGQQAEICDREFQLGLVLNNLRQAMSTAESRHQAEREFLKSRIEVLERLSSSPLQGDHAADLKAVPAATNLQISENLQHLEGNRLTAERFEELRRADSEEIADLKLTIEGLRRKIDRLKTGPNGLRSEEAKLSEKQGRGRGLEGRPGFNGRVLSELLLQVVDDLRSQKQEIRLPFVGDPARLLNECDPDERKFMARILRRIALNWGPPHHSHEAVLPGLFDG